MPLQIEQGRRTANPRIVCDYCGTVIQRGSEGNYQWQHPAEGDLAPVAFTHKQCCHAFEATHPGRWAAIELSWLLPFLARNLAVDVAKTAAEIKLLNT